MNFLVLSAVATGLGMVFYGSINLLAWESERIRLGESSIVESAIVPITVGIGVMVLGSTFASTIE